MLRKSDEALQPSTAPDMATRLSASQLALGEGEAHRSQAQASSGSPVLVHQLPSIAAQDRLKSELQADLINLIQKEFDKEDSSLGMFYDHMYDVEKALRKGVNYTREGSARYDQLMETGQHLHQSYIDFKRDPSQYSVFELISLRKRFISHLEDIAASTYGPIGPSIFDVKLEGYKKDTAAHVRFAREAQQKNWP